MPSGYDERGGRLARIALVTAMAISAAVILIGGRDLWFWSDELDWLVGFADFAPRSLLTPHASHLLAIPRVIYEVLPRIFGVDYLPFRVLGVICLQANAVLVFHLVRRRMGPVVALMPALVLLFYGSAQDVVVSPLGIPFTLSIALGLGALAAVERRTLRGDVAAMFLLSLSILSHTFGTIVALGVAAYYLLERGRRRELWVAVVPIVLWFAWWLWARQFDQEIASSSNVLGAPLFVVEAAGSALEGMFGIPPELGGHVHPLAVLLRVGFALLAVAGGALLAVRLASGRGTPWTWAYLVSILAFWGGIALAEGPDRSVTTPRYMLFGAIMIVLLAAEVFRDRELSPRALRRTAGVAALCLAGNLAFLIYIFPGFADDARDVKAQLGSVEIGGAAVDPAFRVRALGPPASEFIPSPAFALDEFAADVGPLGDSVEALRGQPEDVRRGADFVLVRALRIAAVELPAGGGTRATECVDHPPAADGYTTFELPPGADSVELVRDSGAVGAELDLGRFADVPDTAVGVLRPGRAAAILIPDDGIDQPWTARTTGTVRVCAISGDTGATRADRGK
ncbi:MAG: hypothetical protein U0R51_05675 [Solirubrobacterales bacterium]